LRLLDDLVGEREDGGHHDRRPRRPLQGIVVSEQ
jgi:hypothetical protein